MQRNVHFKYRNGRLLPADMLGKIVTKGESRVPYKRQPLLYLCCFVRIDLLPRPDNHATNLNARCPHKNNCDLLKAGAYYRLFFLVFFGTLVEFARSRRELYV